LEPNWFTGKNHLDTNVGKAARGGKEKKSQETSGALKNKK